MRCNGLLIRRMLCRGVGLFVCVSRLATAQDGTVPTAGASGSSGVILGSADPSADTGRMVPAHTSWAPYTTAGQCVAAMQAVQHRVARQNRAMQLEYKDSVHVPLLMEGRLPMPANMTSGAMTAGRVCAQRLAVATAPAVTLPDYLMLALLLHDDTLAHAVARREQTVATTPHEQVALLASAFAATLAMSPPRADLAAVLLRPLDSLPDAWIERFYARKALMSLAPTPAAKAAYEDTLVTLSTHFTPTGLEQGLLGINVFDLYRGYLAQLRGRTATEAAAAQRYRMVRARYLALGAQLRAAGILDRDPQRLMYLNNAPPPL